MFFSSRKAMHTLINCLWIAAKIRRVKIIQPLYPAALDAPERSLDPLGTHRAHMADAQDCPCWSCSNRKGCATHCDQFTIYLRSDI